MPMMSMSHKHDNTALCLLVNIAGHLGAERVCNISNLPLFYFVIHFSFNYFLRLMFTNCCKACLQCAGVSCSVSTLCLKKMHQLWNSIAQNYKEQFWYHLAEIFKILWNRVCMLQFLCRFAFLSTFRLSNRTPKIMRILKITRHTACQHGTIQ